MGGGEFPYVEQFLHWFISCVFVGLMLSASFCEYGIVNMCFVTRNLFDVRSKYVGHFTRPSSAD